MNITTENNENGARESEWNLQLELRDYFAAKLLPIMWEKSIAAYWYSDFNEKIAVEAYAAADAMMKVRGDK